MNQISQNIKNSGASTSGVVKRNNLITRKIIVDLFCFSEFVIVNLSGFITKYLYLDIYLQHRSPNLQYLLLIGLGALLYIFVSKLNNAYSYKNIVDTFRASTQNVFNLTLTFIILIISLYLLKVSDTYSRIWMVSWFFLLQLSLFSNKYLWWRVVVKMIQNNSINQRAAIIGFGEVFERALKEVEDQSGLLTLVFKCEFSNRVEENDGLEFLCEAGRTNQFDTIIVAIPSHSDKAINRVIKRLMLLPVEIQFTPEFNFPRVGDIKVDKVGSMEVLNIQSRPFANWDVIVKFIEDKILSFVCLALLLPVFATISLAIKLESSGPVFFAQRRNGLNNQIINVFKFRTMTVMENDEAEIKQASANDCRVTKVGKFLRRTSLDEIPQLYNVLKGEMSIVGPRPHAVSHNNYYSALLENYTNRHKVKPGMTGWAQINGFRGETKELEKMEQRVIHDLEYINNWSIWLDIRIILLTPFTIIKGDNAY